MEEEPQTEPAATEDDPPEPAKAELDWKSEARKWEKRAKENSDAAARLKEFEDSQKTDADRQAERLAELESTSRTSSAEAARLRVALRKGLPEDLVDRLRGESVEEIEQDADQLLALIQPEDRVDLSRRPQERLKPGQQIEMPTTDMSAIADSIFNEDRF